MHRAGAGAHLGAPLPFRWEQCDYSPARFTVTLTGGQTGSVTLGVTMVFAVSHAFSLRTVIVFEAFTRRPSAVVRFGGEAS